MPRASDDRPPSLWRAPPLWLRWVVTAMAFAGAIVAVVLIVHAVNKVDPGTGGGAASPAELESANRETRIVVTADQAPHTAALRGGSSPRAAITTAVTADMRSRIASRRLDGPLDRSGCTQTGVRGATLAFRCSVVAADVTYPFVGVVDQDAKRTTWCKVDPAPTPGETIPVSTRCRLPAMTP